MKALTYTLTALLIAAGTASAESHFTGTGYAPIQKSTGYTPSQPNQNQTGYAPPQQNQTAYGPNSQPSNGYAPAQQTASHQGYAPPQQGGYGPNQQNPSQQGYGPQQQTSYRPVGYQPQPNDPAPMPQPKLGFMGTMIYGYGLRVDSVRPGSQAQQIGLESGDVLTHIDDTLIESFDHYLELLRHSAEYHHGHVTLTLKNSNPYTAGPVVTLNFHLN